MYRYTIKMEIDGAESTFPWENEVEYEIGERVPLSEENCPVIHDENGEELKPAVFPRPLYGTVVAKEKLKDS